MTLVKLQFTYPELDPGAEGSLQGVNPAGITFWKPALISGCSAGFPLRKFCGTCVWLANPGSPPAASGCRKGITCVPKKPVVGNPVGAPPTIGPRVAKFTFGAAVATFRNML